MSQENLEPAAPSTEVGAAPTPTTPPTTAPEQAEVPAIRVGNSGAHIARAAREIDQQQLRAAEEGQQPEPRTGSESADDTSGATTGGQPATPQATPTDEMATLRQRLDELEKERNATRDATRAAELQTLNQQQQQEYLELQADAEAAQRKAVRDQQRLDNLLAEYQVAVSERDYETQEALAQAYNEQLEDLKISQRAAQRLAQQQQQFKAYSDNQYHQAKMREQAAQIGKIAQKYGLTPEDVQKVNPKLDINNPFEVQETMLEALSRKLSAKVTETDKAAKEQATQIRKEILNEFDNSPGAQPHPGGSTNTATGASLGIRVGNSGALLEKAFRNQR